MASVSAPGTPVGDIGPVPSVANRPSTPIKREYRTLYRFGDKTWRHSDYYGNLASEMSPYFVGPMPVDEFLSEFLPSPSQAVPSSFANDMFASVISSNDEAGMYNPFVRSYLFSFTLAFIFFLSDSRS